MLSLAFKKPGLFHELERPGCFRQMAITSPEVVAEPTP
jgi:hypothetical protein